MKKFNFSYDKKNDDLFLYHPTSKSTGSVEIGDLVLDFNNKKKLVGIQISKASNFLKELITEKNISDILKSLQECKVEIKNKNNILIIKMHLFGKNKEITPIISMPSINEPSPALACA